MIINDPDFHTQVSFTWHLGDCYSKPSDQLLYVHIPKNASSFTRGKLTDMGFELLNYHLEQKYTNPVLAVLRDPFERWITGALEYLTRQFKDPVGVINSKEILFEQFEVDEHTARQTKFLHGLDTNNITFLKCDDNYKNNLVHFFNEKNIALSSKPDWRNALVESSVKRKLKPLLLEKINQLKLVEYLEPDYKLIKSIEFYAPSGQHNL
jgi:hypothetical protein